MIVKVDAKVDVKVDVVMDVKELVRVTALEDVVSVVSAQPLYSNVYVY